MFFIFAASPVIKLTMFDTSCTTEFAPCKSKRLTPHTSNFQVFSAANNLYGFILFNPIFRSGKVALYSILFFTPVFYEMFLCVNCMVWIYYLNTTFNQFSQKIDLAVRYCVVVVLWCVTPVSDER